MFTGRKEQHRKNASSEQRWITDAKRDAKNNLAQAKQDFAKGNKVRGEFHLQEAKNSLSWVGKRKRILQKEKRLSE